MIAIQQIQAAVDTYLDRHPGDAGRIAALIDALANPGAPDHQHFDLRYAFTVAARPELCLQRDEVHDFAWLPAAEIQPAILAGRIAAATA